MKLRLTFLITGILIFFVSASFGQKKQIKKAIQEGKNGDMMFVANFKQPYDLEVVKSKCLDLGYITISYTERSYSKFGAVVKGVHRLYFMEYNDFYIRKAIEGNDKNYLNCGSFNDTQTKAASQSDYCYICRSGKAMFGRWNGKTSEGWANGEGSFTILYLNKSRTELEGRFMRGKMRGKFKSTHYINNSDQYTVTFDNWNASGRHGLVIKYFKNHSRFMPQRVVISYTNGSPDGVIALSYHTDGTIRELEYLGGEDFQEIPDKGESIEDLILSSLQCLVIDKTTDLVKSPAARAMVENIVTLVIKNEEFQLENVEKSALKHTIDQKLEKNGYKNLAKALSVADFINCVFN